MSTSNSSRSNLFDLTTDIVLTDYSGKTYPLSGDQSNAQALSLKIYESLDLPYLQAELSLADNGVNLIGRVPIQGMEKVTFGIKTPYFSDTEYKYEFRVAAIRDRSGIGRLQTYTLDLISYEGLQNEGLRVGKMYADYGQNIVKNIMNDYFKTTKKVDVSDPCKYQMKMIPRNQRPFELIYSLLSKCVPSSANPTISSANSSSFNINSSTTTSGQSDAHSDSKLSGSAGYFFWETYDGFNFTSIDKLCNPGTGVKDTFSYKAAKTDGNTDPGRSIIEYQYISEIDVLKKLRNGTYNSMMVFFNPSTGNYEEYEYDINTSYPMMKHLGKDEKIPDGPKQLAKYPTRIMTQFVDSETFYNGTDIASPDPIDNSTGGGSSFPDYKKYYMAQSISRKLLLKNQEMHITINGNLTLRAGDRINILLPNFSAESLRTTEQYDNQHSGLYLIKDITYEFYLKKNNQSNITVTNMTLIRDSFGSFTLEV